MNTNYNENTKSFFEEMWNLTHIEINETSVFESID